LHTKCKIIHTDIKPENVLIVMDNAASLNQQIDEAITTLKDRGYGGHWFPDSYGKFIISSIKNSISNWRKKSFVFLFISQILVSSLEKKRSKKSPSPSAQPPSNITSLNITKNHDDTHEEKKSSSPVLVDHDANSNSRSVAANSLDLSSDDDHIDKQTGPSAGSSTTTTSSSFIDNNKKPSISFDDDLKSFITDIKSSEIEKPELDKENSSIGEKQQVKEQRRERGSVSSVVSSQSKNGNENKVNRT
jgi:hypothetical protein